MTDAQKIDQIEHSLRNYALRDIKLISRQDTLIASFILCSCFIEHISTFRYGMKKRLSEIEYVRFIDEYLNKSDSTRYDGKKLRYDLRNKLVHNYSLGDTYGLTKGFPNMHLKKMENLLVCLNLESFVADLEESLNQYIKDLKENRGDLKSLALSAFENVKIISF